MTRVPKLGEVWTTNCGTAYTCIDAEPDDRLCYGWSYSADEWSVKTYMRVIDLTPPKAEPPEWLKVAPWTLIAWAGEAGMGQGWESAEAALIAPIWDGWAGAINVLTGEWVPRD